LFHFWGVDAEDEAFRGRVIGLRGDVTVTRFGLTEAEYRELVDSCTHIVHAAGNVRMNLPIEVARHSAVDSAKHIVALARACLARGFLEKVEFVSTVGVGGRLTYVPEDWLTEPRIFHNTYEQAKAEAEEYLREQMEQHQLPVTVHRPSMVVGDAHTGKIIHFQIFYYLCEFLSGRQTFGLMPVLNNARLDTIPVDYVTNAIRWSSCQPATAGKIFHLCSGPDQAMELPWLIQALRGILIAHGEQLPRLRLVPLWLFESALPLVKRFTAKKARKALNNLSLFLDYASDRQQFANERTTLLLSSAGMVVPLPGSYLANLLTAYLAQARK
jgi:thioester reductase-like protein